MASIYEKVRYSSLFKTGILITGGASGIGAAHVEAFTSQGARVEFLDIDKEAGAAIAVQHKGSQFHHCDLTDTHAVREAINKIESERGTIDVLINNAACDQRRDFWSYELEDWQQDIAVNLSHQFFVTQAVARHMRTRRRGAIVMTGSVSWMRGRPSMASM